MSEPNFCYNYFKYELFLLPDPMINLPESLKDINPFNLRHKFITEYWLGRLEGNLQNTRDYLWWTKWHWGRFSPSTSVSPANPQSTNCSIIIIIYHPGLVQ
jgi:hypothetical protein